MFVRSVWVYGSKAYTRRPSFPEGVVPLHGPREVPVFDLEPRLVYRVDYPGDCRFTAETTEVSLLTRAHPEAQVSILPVEY